MKPIAISTTLILVLTLYLTSIAAEADGVDVAEFNDSGDLIVPADLDTWVFLGSSLGMGYSQDSFDPGSPGMFQIVRIEPQAYKAFLETGEFVDGTMIALHFYGSQNNVSINRSGFVMDNLHFAEIHYKDSKYPDGFNFFTFNPGDETAAEVALPNECVECHKRDGAYDGVFVQFYPDIQQHLPSDVQEWLSQEQSPH